MVSISLTVLVICVQVQRRTRRRDGVGRISVTGVPLTMQLAGKGTWLQELYFGRAVEHPLLYLPLFLCCGPSI